MASEWTTWAAYLLKLMLEGWRSTRTTKAARKGAHRKRLCAKLGREFNCDDARRNALSNRNASSSDQPKTEKLRCSSPRVCRPTSPQPPTINHNHLQQLQRHSFQAYRFFQMEGADVFLFWNLNSTWLYQLIARSVETTSPVRLAADPARHMPEICNV